MELASKAVRSIGCCCSVSLARFWTSVLSGGVAAAAAAAWLGCAGAVCGGPLLLPLPVRCALAARSWLIAAMACWSAAMAVEWWCSRGVFEPK